jgi:hypothetical protein
MTEQDHARYEGEVGAYVLGALGDSEREAFERHLSSCSRCSEEVTRLRPVTDVLPLSVPQVEPPRTLRASLLEIAERESGERQATVGRTEGRLRSISLLFGRSGHRLRPVAALSGLLLVIGLLAGYGVSRLAEDGEQRTLEADVDQQRLPRGSARLVIPESDWKGAILRVRGLPRLGPGRVYQVWLDRDSEVVSQAIFDVDRRGWGAAAVPDAPGGARAVMVTREPAGGSRAPTERPILRVRL